MNTANFLNILKQKVYICVGLFLLFILSQLPMLGIEITQYRNLQSFLVYTILNLISITGGLFISKQLGLFSVKPPDILSIAPFKRKGKNDIKYDSIFLRPFLYLLIIAFGVILLFVANYIPAMLVALSSHSGQELLSKSSHNQSSIIFYINHSNTWDFIFSFSLAPLFEEIIFRYGIFSLFKKEKNQIFAILLSTISFASLHMIGSFDNPMMWMIYLLSAVVLSGFYAYFKNIYLNIAIHLLYNSIILATLFIH